VDELDRVCNPREADWIDGEGKLIWVDGEATLAFGKHEGATLRTVALEAPDYLAWVLGGNFDSELKEIVSRALDGDFPAR